MKFGWLLGIGAAVFVHPWDMLAPDRTARYWMPWLVAMPVETTIAICSVLFGGVLERLPSLRIGFAHAGGSFPGTFGRISHGFVARPDLVAVANPVPTTCTPEPTGPPGGLKLSILGNSRNGFDGLDALACFTIEIARSVRSSVT